MNRARTLLLPAFASLLFACSTTGGGADGDAAQATLHVLEQGDITSTAYRAHLVRIDGEPVVPGNRRNFSVPAGQHTLAFKLDVASLHAYESGASRRIPKPSQSAANVDERALAVELEPGKRYAFGARIEESRYANWQPFVIELVEERD